MQSGAGWQHGVVMAVVTWLPGVDVGSCSGENLFVRMAQDPKTIDHQISS